MLAHKRITDRINPLFIGNDCINLAYEFILHQIIIQLVGQPYEYQLSSTVFSCRHQQN